jgi:hypothetical protein
MVFEWLKTRWLILPFKTGQKVCPENGRLNTRLSRFQMVTTSNLSLIANKAGFKFFKQNLTTVCCP